MKRFDPKLVKVIALWCGTEHEGERQSAWARIETLAAQADMTFEAAIRQDEAERNSGATSPLNIFAGFDDFMEASQPGWKAARARDRAEKIAARAARRKVLFERFGSEEAITAPCERERLILEAVKQWRTVRKCAPPPACVPWLDLSNGADRRFRQSTCRVRAMDRGCEEW